MSILSNISGTDCIKVLVKFGFRIIRQEGSHIILRKDEPFTQLVVPNHKELDKGTLRAIIKQSGININDFIKNI